MAKVENSNNFNAEPVYGHASSVVFDANESRTSEKIGTGLTQFCSAGVRTQLKHHMRILRKKFGAGSKIGRRASNVEGAAHNLEHGIEPGPTGEFQRANLEKTIRRGLIEITQLASQP